MFITLVVFVCRQVLPAVSAVSLIDMKHIADTYEIIGIDEGQFVSTLLEMFFCCSWALFFFIFDALRPNQQFSVTPLVVSLELATLSSPV